MQGRAQGGGIGDRRGLRSITGECHQIDAFWRKAFHRLRQHIDFLIELVIAVRQGAVPVYPQPAALGRGRGGGGLVVDEEETLAIRVLPGHHRGCQLPAGNNKARG